MPGLIAYLTALLVAITAVAGVAGGCSFCYGAFHWLTGDHQRGKSWIVGALIGVGIVLCAQSMGTFLAGLPHA